MATSHSLILIMMSNFVSFTNVISNGFVFISSSHKENLIWLDLRQGLLKGDATLGKWLE